MTRVLIVGAKAYPAFSDRGIASGGMEQYVERLVDELCHLGIDIDLVTGTTQLAPKLETYLGGRLRVHRRKLVGGTLLQPIVLAIQSLRDSVIIGRQVDVLNPQTPLAGFICLIPKLLYRKRLVLTHHALTSDPKYSKRPLMAIFYRLIERSVLRRCNHLISVGRSLTQYLRSQYSFECPVTFIPTGAHIPNDSNLERTQSGLQSIRKKPFTIIFIGRVIPWKRALDLAKAAVDYCSDKDYKFIFVGEGEAIGELESYIGRAGRRGNHCVITGKVSEQRKQEILSSSDLFVLPSENEVFPVSILEALAFGVPVLATDIGDIKDIVYESKAGFTFEVGDIGAIGKLIRQIAETPELHASLRRNAIAYARRQGWANRAKSYVEAIEGKSSKIRTTTHQIC